MLTSIPCRVGHARSGAGWPTVLLLVSIVFTSACGGDATGTGPVDSEAPENETPVPELPVPETPVPEPADELVPLKVALYQALTSTVSGDGAAVTCVSEGYGDWSGRTNPDGQVMQGLRLDGSAFSIISECNVALTGTSSFGEEGRLVHLERIERDGNRADAVMLYRRSAIESVAYDCTLNREGVNWIAEGCTPGSESDAAGIRVAAYLKLWELSGPDLSSYQFCLTEREGDSVRDPSAEVILRLMMQSTPRPFAPGSTCRHDGVNHRTSDGRVARLLHLDQVDEATNQASVSGNSEWAWYANHFNCNLTKSGLTWSTGTCTPDLDAEVPLSQDVAVRIALFETLLALEGSSGLSTTCLSEGPNWADLQDPEGAVLNGLASSGSTFLPASGCSFAFGGTSTAGGERAQLFHIEWIRLSDMRAAVYFQRSGLDAGGYLCNLGNVDGQWVADCSPNEGHSQNSRSVAIYQALTEWGEFPVPEAYCVSSADAVQVDPSPSRIFRLSGTQRPIVPLSSCRWERDVLYTASGDIAHQLHIGNLEHAVYRTTTQEHAVLACTTAKQGDVWTAECSRRAEPELTEAEVAVRVAAHLYNMSRQDHPNYERNTVCIGESVGQFGSYLQAESAPVLQALAAADSRFVDGSRCRLNGASGALSGAPYVNAAGNPAQVSLVSAARWQDGKATFDVVLAFNASDHHGFTCTLEKVDGVWKVTSTTGHWST